MTPPPNQPLDTLAAELEKAAKECYGINSWDYKGHVVREIDRKHILSLLAERKRNLKVIDELDRTLHEIIVNPYCPAREFATNCLALVAKIKGES